MISLLGANHKLGNFGIDITAGGNQMYRKMEYNSVLVTDFIIPGLVHRNEWKNQRILSITKQKEK